MEPLDILLFVVYAVFIFVISLCIGSFLNVVVYRVPNKMSLIKPGSHCPVCNHPLKWYDNIPLLSFLLLKGKCRYCHTKISPFYFIVELSTAVLCTLIFIRFGVSFNALFGILFTYVLIAIAFIDIEHFIIPDTLNIIIAVIGIVGVFLNPLNYGDGTIFIGYASKLISIGVNALIIMSLILFSKLLKKEVMGGGDIKLMIAAGLVLGWQLLLLGIFIASLIAIIIELPFGKKMRKNGENHVLPFGPYLAFGFLIAYVFGINLIEWYLHLFVMV